MIGDKMSDKDKVIEAFKNSEEPLNATKVSEISGVEKKEVDKIMKELKKDETITCSGLQRRRLCRARGGNHGRAV